MPGLTQIQDDLLLVADGSYTWVSRKAFLLPEGCTRADQVIEALINDRSYGATYAGNDNVDGVEKIHGPYVRSEIRVQCFDATSEESLMTAVVEFTEDAPAQALAVVNDHLIPMISSASEIWRLQDLRSTAEHEWGHVVEPFDEYVLIDWSARRGELLVLGGD